MSVSLFLASLQGSTMSITASQEGLRRKREFSLVSPGSLRRNIPGDRRALSVCAYSSAPYTPYVDCFLELCNWANKDICHSYEGTEPAICEASKKKAPTTGVDLCCGAPSLLNTQFHRTPTLDKVTLADAACRVRCRELMPPRVTFNQ